MTLENTPLGAVLTGDLISSRDTGSDAVNAALGALSATAADIGRLHGFDPMFTRSRGDGWQFWCPKPQRSLYVALTLVAGLRAADTGLDTRLAVGIGPVDNLGSGTLADAAGTAFVISGDTLDAMPDDRRMAIAGTGVTGWQVAVFDMADWIAQGWTAPQAEAFRMRNLIERGNNTARARQLGITRQAFEARLKGTGLSAMQSALAAFADHRFEAAS